MNEGCIQKIPFFFFQKWSNLHGRTAISCLKRKSKFQIFLIFILRIMVKNNEAGNFFNAVEREPVPMRVFNPKASGGLGCGAPGVGCKGCSRPQKKNIYFLCLKILVQNFKKIQFFSSNLHERFRIG